jgi:hypothetical protein
MGFVLGLSGPARAGKDTVADFLIQNHGWTGKLSFARNLKNMCKSIFELSESDVETQEGKKRKFDSPIIFTQSQLGAIMYWMAQTHPNAKIDNEVHTAVKSLLGRELNTPREILQIVGTNVCRALVPTYHVDIVLKDAQVEGLWIITDVRFPNEADLILDELEGSVVNVSRDIDNEGAVDMTHPSETAMKQWGRFADTVDNSKDGLDYLFKEVSEFLERNNFKCQTTQ